MAVLYTSFCNDGDVTASFSYDTFKLYKPGIGSHTRIFMFKATHIVALSLVAVISFVGCTKDDDNKSDDTSKTTVLEGTWKNSIGETKTYTGDNLLFSATFSDINSTIVSKASLIFSIEGTKTLQINNKTVNKIKITNVNTCSEVLTLLTQDAVTEFNNENVCKTTWTINTPVEIGTCIFPSETLSFCGEVNGNKDIAYIDGDKLYTGDETTKGSDGYPEALETEFSTRQ